MAASVVVSQDDVETVHDDHERVQETAACGLTPTDDDDNADADDDDEEDNTPPQSSSELPFPLFAPKAFYVLDQTTAPRRWCLRLITSPYPFTSAAVYL